MISSRDETNVAPTFDSRWEEIYAAGHQHNRWPFDQVVSFYHRARPTGDSRNRPRWLLEVGCGTGNNLLAAALDGLNVAGIEASPTACTVARERLSEAGIVADIRLGDFTRLPWTSDSFDLAVDRLAITHTSLEGARLAISEVHRTLKADGLFLFNCFGPQNEGITELDDISRHIHTSELTGTLEGVGAVSFFSEAGVRELFNDTSWTFEAFQLVSYRSVMETTPLQPNAMLSEWRVIARKLPR